MPVQKLDTITLKSGGSATLFHAQPPVDPAAGAKLGWFLEQIWGDHDKPDLFVVATLKGIYEQTARNDFVWAEVDGAVVSTAWTITPSDDPRVGSLGEVFTVPQMRGQGLASQVMRAILNVFDKRGGRCMFLGTTNPAAERIYLRYGFEPYPERLMRRLTTNDSTFDDLWFAGSEAVTTREMVWGDLPRVVALYGHPNDWVSICYPQGLFSSTYVRHGRCNSFFKYTWQATRATEAGVWTGLFNATGALVGACPVYPRGNETHVIGGELDLFVHPSFVSHAPLLLQHTLTVLRERGWRSVMAHIPSHDHEKLTILRESSGFEHIVTLSDALSIDEKLYNVDVMQTLL